MWVIIEEMPDPYRYSHRAAGDWGVYPYNGAIRSRVSAEEAEEIVASDPDGYAHVVGDDARVGYGATVGDDATADQIRDARVRRARRRAERASQYRARHPDVPVVPDLDRAILRSIDGAQWRLDMREWHSTTACGTAHCRAGSAIHLAGEAGYALEERVGSQRAGAMIYLASAGYVPHFFADGESALADMRARAEDAAQLEAEDAAGAHTTREEGL